MNFIQVFILSSLAMADGGGDHSHGPEGSQVVGMVIIAVLAGVGLWIFSRKKK